VARATAFAELPLEMREERDRLRAAGAAGVDETIHLARIKYVLQEIKPWLVNSRSAVSKIDWNVAPFHILMGGNKLDRGFTVEGLTVTYMNRPTTTQIDTLEQRARAFGYRSDLLPYCQFFATPRTLKVLRDIVFTEYDLRARLQDWLVGGGTVESWAHEVGLMLPDGTKPTRVNVLVALNSFNATSHWHSLRRPSLDPEARRANKQLVQSIGLLDAARTDYGRLHHRTTSLKLSVLLDSVIRRWRVASYSPDWRIDEIVRFLERQLPRDPMTTVMLMELEDGSPRLRDWDEQTGFVNLFQGEDTSPPGTSPRYPGDRYVLNLDKDPTQIVMQVHHVQPRGMAGLSDLYTLALHLGDTANVRRGASHNE
jgi:Z1 domain